MAGAAQFAEWTAAAAGAVALAGGALAWGAMAPGAQWFGPVMTAPTRPGELALTFDDGPNPAHTPQLLDLLARQGVRATFFVIGRYAQAQPELVRRAAAEGHEIGNHSWSHPNLALCGAARTRDELTRCNAVLEGLLGKPGRLFRPPFGGRNPATLRVARELGLTPVTWTGITTDWREPDAAKIAARLIAGAEKTARRDQAVNLVLHDGGHLEPTANRGPSIAAVERIIDRFKPTHKFVTLAEWL